ncbi:hypothetical protein [Pseudoxanthomonas sp. X-1]|uniref:hypothetical protein n=1 Tax=Pseudoxanthomonas sp. X-1 TaxID=2571115 RepID=UPI00110A4DD3|nr:hypothetical protein [Pseudoxanthomonas sp. X-1]TMN16193.1 hypothetical protein FF950_18985 [Pseudoxanthomonas sp. X-1]UAY74709.1 hypothetical protein LAJ50_00025 [Pseudoxanthomonas sp. X-1]
MESWPVRAGDTSLFLECESGVVKMVCVSYSGVGIENAPQLEACSESSPAARISLPGGIYIESTVEKLMEWQTVLSGQQVFDLDFDNPQLRFRAENPSEDGMIPITSFGSSRGEILNAALDFDAIGKAFLVNSVDHVRVESVAHFREGRIAYASGRHVDAYNNYYLFLETRYCDGKFGNERQTKLLCQVPDFLKYLNEAIVYFRQEATEKQPRKSKHLEEVFKPDSTAYKKIESLVLLRGHLRHHSLKSPHRWNPNRQQEYEMPARFLGLVVGNIVLSESLRDIYDPVIQEKFRDISSNAGLKTEIKVSTYRIDRKPTLVVDMTFPTTVTSTRLCLRATRDTIDLCENKEQLSDTTKLAAEANGLELFVAEVGIWAYTVTRSVKGMPERNYIRCVFEYLKAGAVLRGEFKLPIQRSTIDVLSGWRLLESCFDWIENRDPTTRIVTLRIFLNEFESPLIRYAVGAQVKR